MPAFKYRQRWYRRAQLFNQIIPVVVDDWLFDTSSLTARLLKRCAQSFNVQLLSQSYASISAAERSAMRLPQSCAALVREVLLCDDQTPLVYARSVIPVSTLKGPLRCYAKMGERPLGAMLFADRTMRRGEVEVTSTLPQHCCSAKKIKAGVHSDSVIWGRRSVFWVSGKPLLVGEYFLPALFKMCDQMTL